MGFQYHIILLLVKPETRTETRVFGDLKPEPEFQNPNRVLPTLVAISRWKHPFPFEHGS